MPKTTPKAATATSRRASTQALVRDLADLTLPSEPDFFYTLYNDPRAQEPFEDLCQQIRTELQYEDRGKNPDRFDRLIAALPDDLQNEMTAYDDHHNDYAEVRARAAYRIGVAIGRRMGGAR